VKRTLFLHIGPPKTGTTTIQMFFRDNARTFLKQGLFRPRTGTEEIDHFHRPLVFAFMPQSRRPGLRQKLAAELRDHGLPERVFITAEFFASRIDQPEYVASLRQFCSELGYRLHVIAYLRPQVPSLNSLFTQYVKNWRVPETMDTFLDHQLSLAQHNYVSLFRSVMDVPDIELTIRPFNRETLDKGITRDICEVIGLRHDSVELARPVDANIAPGPKTIEAFQTLARRVPAELPGFDRERLSALTRPLIMAAGALGWNREKFGGITPEQQDMIEKRVQDTNEMLARRVWSKSWTEVFSPDDCQPPPFNTFDLAAADASERQQFQEFLAESMDLIREFAGTSAAVRDEP
jgi:hypothetical protein